MAVLGDSSPRAVFYDVVAVFGRGHDVVELLIGNIGPAGYAAVDDRLHLVVDGIEVNRTCHDDHIGCLKKTGMPLKDIRTYIDMAMQGDETIESRLKMICQQREPDSERQSTGPQGCPKEKSE